MTKPCPEITNAKALQQTLANFASSFDGQGSPAGRTIKLAFEAAAGFLKASVDNDAPKILTIEEGMAFANVLTAGMDRILEFSEMEEIDIPFGR